MAQDLATDASVAQSANNTTVPRIDEQAKLPPPFIGTTLPSTQTLKGAGDERPKLEPKETKPGPRPESTESVYERRADEFTFRPAEPGRETIQGKCDDSGIYPFTCQNGGQSVSTAIAIDGQRSTLEKPASVAIARDELIKEFGDKAAFVHHGPIKRIFSVSANMSPEQRVERMQRFLDRFEANQAIIAELRMNAGNPAGAKQCWDQVELAYKQAKELLAGNIDPKTHQDNSVYNTERRFHLAEQALWHCSDQTTPGQAMLITCGQTAVEGRVIGYAPGEFVRTLKEAALTASFTSTDGTKHYKFNPSHLRLAHAQLCFDIDNHPRAGNGNRSFADALFQKLCICIDRDNKRRPQPNTDLNENNNIYSSGLLTLAKLFTGVESPAHFIGLERYGLRQMPTEKRREILAAGEGPIFVQSRSPAHAWVNIAHTERNKETGKLMVEEWVNDTGTSIDHAGSFTSLNSHGSRVSSRRRRGYLRTRRTGR